MTMRRLKGSCALVLALCLLWTCVPPPALATESAANTAYALLYEDGTLVFQLSKTPDAARGAVKNTYTVDLKLSSVNGEEIWFPWTKGGSSITQVDFADTISPVSTRHWFWSLKQLTQIDHIERLDTSRVTDMTAMFGFCSALTELDLRSFDTSKVTSMWSMFQGCSALTKLNLSSFDTSKVTDFMNMFRGCSSLTTIYASEKFAAGAKAWSTGMFEECNSLLGGNGATYDSHFTNAEYARIDSASAPGYFTREGAKPAASAPQVSDTVYAVLYNNGTLVFQRSKTPDASRGSVSKTYTLDLNKRYSEKDTPWGGDSPWNFHVKTVDFADAIAPVSTAYWFYSFDELTKILNLDRLDTSKVTDMSGMFYGCESLKELDLSSFDTSNVKYMTCMFGNSLLMAQGGGTSLKSLNLSGWDTSKVTDMSGMFEGCGKLESLDLSSWDTSNVTDMSWMFANCSALTTIYAGRFDTSKVTHMTNMFYNCESFTALDLSGFDTSKVTSMFCMFENCRKLTELNVSGWNTSGVTNMHAMFCDCESLTALDLSGFDTSKVTDMGSMFDNCFNLTKLDLSGFDTSRVTDMYHMFYDCESLKSLDVSRFNTSNVTDMQSMFDRCASLTALDLRHFDTSNVTDMSWMFAFCSALTKLDLSGWNTSNVTDMFSMFRNCESLKTLDLSAFDTSKVMYMSWMFAGDPKLTTIYVSDKFVTKALESERFTPGAGMTKEESASMFRGDVSLVGGNGTKYDAHFDKGTEYARIDRSGASGYFTRSGAAPASPNPVPRYVAQILVNNEALNPINPDSRDYLTSGNFFTHTQGKQGSYALRVLDQYGKEFTDLNWTLDSPNANVSVSASTVTVKPEARINETYTLRASGSGVSAALALFVIPDMTGKVNLTPELILRIDEEDSKLWEKDYPNTFVEMKGLLATASNLVGIDAAKLIAQGKITADNLRADVTKVMDLAYGDDEDTQALDIYLRYKIMTATGEEVQAEKRLEGFGQRKVTVCYDALETFEPIWAEHALEDGSKEYLPVKPADGLESVYIWEQNGFGPVILTGHAGLRGLLISGGEEEIRDGPSYAITVLKTSGGSVFANVSKARSAAEIVLTVMENNGYRLGAIQVQMTGGAAVAVSGSGLTRTFSMPTGNVTITATFVKTDANAPANAAPELRVTPTASPSWINVKEQTPGTTPKPSTNKKSPFSDVPVDATLFVEIVWADNKGVMKGYRDGTFDPDKAVSSITAVVVLGRLDDSSLKNASTGLWYKPYETWANNKGLLKAGTRNEESIVLQDTVFSRGSMALLLTRYLKSKGRNVTPAQKVTFQDANQMRPGEEAAFQYLYGIGIFKGTSSNRMSPRGHLTRAQLAALLYRLNGVI